MNEQSLKELGLNDRQVKTYLGLEGGQGFIKARTGGELPNSCEVSHETTSRLTPNPSLPAGIF